MHRKQAALHGPLPATKHRFKDWLAARDNATVRAAATAAAAATDDVPVPYALLLVVKFAHVGSEWFASLVEKQPLAAFKHEANACVRSTELIGALVRGGGCDKIGPKRLQASNGSASRPLLGVSFNAGAFGAAGLSTWDEALAAAPPKVPVVVASLTRTNAVKWAWSVYRSQAFNQENHVRSNVSWERVHVDPVRFAGYARGAGKNIVSVRQRADALAAMLAKYTNAAHPAAVHITYEQMQNDSAGVLQRLFELVGVPFSEEHHAQRDSTRKGAPEALSQAILNLDEVAAQPALSTPCARQMFSLGAGEDAVWPCI